MALFVAALLVDAWPAAAIPAFARKYQTSCLTCHTIYPKLNPFGESFRHNGLRFPGIDSDAVKQGVVPMGQEAYRKEFPDAVWPGILPAGVPIAVGFNGNAILHPDSGSGGALEDNGARFLLDDLIQEGHVWAGGSFDDQFTFFGEMTVSSEGAEIEHAAVHLNDVLGPPYLCNLVIGRDVPALSGFAPHSSYVSDMMIPPLSVTALYGAESDSWNLTDPHPQIELNGVMKGRADYSLGVIAGTNAEPHNSDNVYGHIGCKLGGRRLDGVDTTWVPDPRRPWAEQSLTLGAFAYRSVSRFVGADDVTRDDRAVVLGGEVRIRWSSWELDSGVYHEDHDHAANGGKVRGLGQYNEFSYIVYPWFVPALRAEYSRLKPAGGAAIYDLRLLPAIAMLLRPNLKVSVAAQIESARGSPPGGWGPAGGLIRPSTDGHGAPRSAGPEVEVLAATIAFAF